MNVVEVSAAETAEPVSDSAGCSENNASKLLGLEKSVSSVSHPAGVLRSPSSPLNTAGSRSRSG